MGLEGTKDFLAWPGEESEEQRENVGREGRPDVGGVEAEPERQKLHCGCHGKKVRVREVHGWWMVGG